MAESEASKHQKDSSPKIHPSNAGTKIQNTLVRTFSTLRGKKKVQKECTSPTSSTKPLSSDSPNSEVGIFNKSSPLRRSINNGFKNCRKAVQEIFPSTLKESTPEKTEMERKSSKDCAATDSFIYNIPPKPLSVLQIDDLIKSGYLEEAYPNLLSLQLEFQHEREALGEKTPPVELTNNNKEKDLFLLYKALRTKLHEIVRQSCEVTSSEQLVHVASIIQEEEKREDLGGIGGWRDAWRAAVKDGVKETLMRVQINLNEEQASCLAVHLGLLGKKIVDLLEKVKTELVSSYPPSFNVFETYVSACNEALSEHLKELLEKIQLPKDFYAMLQFLIIEYHSEKILGSPSLQPEMKEQKALTIPDDFLKQVKNKYCTCLKEELHASLGRIITHEEEKVWKEKRTPQRTEDKGLLTSEIHKDICMLVSSYAENSGKIDGNLKKMVLKSCLETVKHFPKRFMVEFLKQKSSFMGSDLLDCCLWAEYHVTYINSFNSLKEHMEGYIGSCPDHMKELAREIDELVFQLKEALLQQFITEIEPFTSSLMTKQWLNTDEEFNKIINRTETYSGYCKSMRPPTSQSFASALHYYVVKEYISQLLKNKYSCKGRKNELAAEKIRDQWGELRNLFREMGSTLDWLHPLGDQLSGIIEQKSDKDIKNLLAPLVENYTDMSERQLSAILYFRDRSIGRYLGLNPVIQHFTELKQNYNQTNQTNNQHRFFNDIK